MRRHLGRSHVSGWAYACAAGDIGPNQKKNIPMRPYITLFGLTTRSVVVAGVVVAGVVLVVAVVVMFSKHCFICMDFHQAQESELALQRRALKDDKKSPKYYVFLYSLQRLGI